jgi:hypothetical protein
LFLKEYKLFPGLVNYTLFTNFPADDPRPWKRREDRINLDDEIMEKHVYLSEKRETSCFINYVDWRFALEGSDFRPRTICLDSRSLWGVHAVYESYPLNFILEHDFQARSKLLLRDGLRNLLLTGVCRTPFEVEKLKDFMILEDGPCIGLAKEYLQAIQWCVNVLKTADPQCVAPEIQYGNFDGDTY